MTRGGVVESRHRAHAVRRARRGGRRVLGRPGPRRLRPLGGEAAPGPPARPPYGLPPEELAIACASHEARPRPARRRARAARARGRHRRRSRVRRRARLPPPAQLLGQARGLPLPLPRARVGDGGLPPPRASAPAGAPRGSLRPPRAGRSAGSPPPIDGCGVVTFALSLAEMARLFAGFARGEPEGMATRGRGHDRPPRAGRRARTRGHRWSCARSPAPSPSAGAEGVLCAGLPDGTGVALKVEDGAYRATYAAAGVVLRLPSSAERPLHSSRGDAVGSISASDGNPVYHFSTVVVESRPDVPVSRRSGSTSPALFSFQRTTLHR